MKFSIKDFFSKCGKIRSFPQICAVGERVKSNNSILLIQTHSDSQYLL